MNLFIENKKVFIGCRFELSDFPRMIKQHNESFPETKGIEEKYTFLSDRPFQDFEELSQFIKDVCKWGHYSGVGGKVLRRNSEENLCKVFEEVRVALIANQPDLGCVLAKVNTLAGLGTPSFASKHLRFMAPNICPVYDSILSNALPYSFDPTGYAEFAEDCSNIAAQLQNDEIVNPVRESVTWFASDVEAAIFSRYY